jgi:hypothetical protein
MQTDLRSLFGHHPYFWIQKTTTEGLILPYKRTVTWFPGSVKIRSTSTATPYAKPQTEYQPGVLILTLFLLLLLLYNYVLILT